MTAISKSYVSIADGAVDPDSPVDTTLMTGLRDNIVFLREWLGESYFAGAVQNHNHDGLNSALVEVGPNLLRNGSFEESSTGWTLVAYTNGSCVVQTTGASHGAYCLAITSASVANGGGYSTSNEFMPVAAGQRVFVGARINSSAGSISSKIEVLWYDSSQSLISASEVYSTTDTLTKWVSGYADAPSTTRYYKVRLTGGVPGVGAGTGTVYFDGVFSSLHLRQETLAGDNDITVRSAELTTTSTTYVEKQKYRVSQSGYLRTVWSQKSNSAGITSWARIYRNGVAYGTERSQAETYGAEKTEDLWFDSGDVVSLFLKLSGGTGTAYMKDFRLTAEKLSVESLPVPLTIL